MSSSKSPPASHSEALVRRLGTRYFLVLLLVAALMLMDQAVVQPLLARMDAFAPAINLAGRQRMLSQKLAKSALAAEQSVTPELQQASRRELDAALTEWISANDALRNGSNEIAIPPIDSDELRREWAAIDRDFEPIVAAAREIVAGVSPAGLEGVDGNRRSSIILEHERPFLQRMERIVDLYEQAAAREVARLRIYSLAIALAVAALLGILGWFVVRPATRAIRRQVDELEHRVALRTDELAETVVSLRQEVAERELAEARSRELAAQLAHADRVASMGHLAVGLAHELNQPLGAIANYAAAASVVTDQSLISDGRLEGYLQQINAAALRAGEIVRRIRKFVAAKRYDDAKPCDVVRVDLAALLRDVLQLCEFELRRAEVVATLDAGRVPAIVDADPIQIQQVAVNLLQNAIQSMTSSPVGRRRLTVTLETHEQWAEVHVADSGPGFASIDLEAPFVPFHTTKADGLGVGLSICRTIIESHGGDIRIHPTEQGADISFKLPLSPSLRPQLLNEPSRIAQPDAVCR